ncbi:CotH kinase family protein [Streptomyces sp. NPDC048845]|uniref:CotH kinase family protein n=1 Tax=Streptomyces sp. NPDC048845 TaxID=3155390 RepID=UPI003413F956
MRTKRRGLLTLLAALAIVMTGVTSADGSPAPPPGDTAAHPAAHRTAAADSAARQQKQQARAEADLTGDITFSVPSGTFRDQVSVALSSAVSGAEIRYTTDGELPTADSARYSAPLEFTATTQLRAQAFVDGAASGEPGTALYTARSFDAEHDLPVLAMDAYGAGKPGREYADVSALLMEPEGGTTSLASAPSVATRAGFHLRGQSSAMFEKAPYRLELWDNQDDDADHPVLGMPADSDWVLRGPFSDKTLIHDAFAYGLGRDMGMQAPRFAFVELYLNTDGEPMAEDDYQGVYMITETIKTSPDRLDIQELKKTDVSLPAVSGGYVFKFEWFASEEPTLECPRTVTNCWQDLEVAEPGSPAPEQEAWLTQHLADFHTSLRSENPSDPETGYPAYIDTASFIDQIIVNELTRELDAYIRSTYFYKDRGEKIVAGPLWDYDLTFGTGGYFNNEKTAGWQFEQVRQPVANDWFVKLMGDPAFAEQVDARWKELRRGILSDEQLNARITELAAPLAGAAERNFAKWPNLTDAMVGPFNTPTAATWQGHVDLMRTWMTERTAWLDTSGWSPDAG